MQHNAHHIVQFLKIIGAELVGILLAAAVWIFSGMLSYFSDPTPASAPKDGSHWFLFIGLTSAFYSMVMAGRTSAWFFGHETRLENYVTGYILLYIVNATFLGTVDISRGAPSGSIVHNALHAWLFVSVPALLILIAIVCIRTIARHYGYNTRL